MKTLLGLFALVCVTTSLLANEIDPAKQFTINGEYIAIKPDESKTDKGTVVSSNESDIGSGDESVPVKARPADLSDAKIVVTYEATNESGEMETVELASGSFVDGRIQFTGEIEEPTDIRIFVEGAEARKILLLAHIVPGGHEISFALVDFDSSNPLHSRLAFVGNSRKVKDPTRKFTVSGDLSSSDTDLSLAHVLIYRIGIDESGNRGMAIASGNMLPKDGRFQFEGEIEHPMVVNIAVSTLAFSDFYSITRAIIEPGAEISVHLSEASNELVALSGTGRHAKLIESWQQSDLYIETMNKQLQAHAEFLAEWDMLLNEVRTSLDEDVRNEAVNKLNEIGTSDDSEHLILERKMSEIRSGKLQEIARNAEDPIDSLLAMELGAFALNSENRSDAFPIYDRLSEVLSDELVTRRVSPARESLVQFIESEENEQNLVAGQLAPSFTLSNLDGDSVALQDVLSENELVLVEFWASWCAPCIADFPDLKEIYTAHSEDGFEIVSVSIDNGFENWEQKSQELELPWIDVGEMEGWDGATAIAYGVQFVPKSYLLDREGYIQAKDLEPEELREYLASRYGETSNGESRNAESESQ